LLIDLFRKKLNEGIGLFLNTKRKMKGALLAPGLEGAKVARRGDGSTHHPFPKSNSA
jgi:hypothetical protein